jgi:hypothetical protein
MLFMAVSRIPNKTRDNSQGKFSACKLFEDMVDKVLFSYFFFLMNDKIGNLCHDGDM